jgi:uridine monophosphate synthetase
MNRAMIYPRKEAKEYGTRAAIEGAYTAGERVIVIDDLITNGESKFEAIDKLTSAGLQVRDVAVLIDRSKNGATVLASRGYALHAVATLPQLLDAWERLGTISPQQKQIVLDFLAA